ncbi:hypothetical protein F4859DRAFT_513362 [Xylaria cf. heliscus]|nr:hypothetical protein F4859DRAFT_513362 [Xylaria cf. heliscus]
MQQRARPSRRSACDRCRDFKLRCDRPSPGADSCERCTKNNAVVRNQLRESDKPLGAFQAEAMANSGVGVLQCVTTLASDQPEASRWDPGLGSLDPSSLARPADGPTDTAGLAANVAMSWNPRSSVSSPLTALHHEYAATAATAATDMNSIDSGIDFDMAMIDFTFPAHAPAGSGRSKLQGHVSPTSMIPCAFDDLIGTQDPAANYALPFPTPDGRGTPHSPDGGSGTTASLKHLSALNIELLRDYEEMSKTYTNTDSLSSLPAMENAIRSTLNRTSRLSEILKELAASSTPTSPAGSPGINLSVAHTGSNMASALNHGTSEELANSREIRGLLNFDAGRRNHDVLLMSTLVTTYILLTQNWRRTLVHLHHLIMTIPTEKLARLSPVLPTLQLGQFHFRASACVQIGALIDLIEANLQTFEIYLGIRPGDEPDRGNGGADRVERLAMSNDPGPIAIRETLLSQERIDTMSNNGSRELSLKEVIHQISGYLFIHMKACKSKH